MAVFLSISFTLCITYALLMLSYWKGWRKLPPAADPDEKPNLKVSVIIPYRDEQEQLPFLLDHLLKLRYPGEFLEIILVDDHSEDSGPRLVQTMAAQHQGLLFAYSLDHASQGKKAALQLGALKATGEILLLSDADCHFNPEWILSLVQPFQKLEIQLVQGPVLIDPANSVPGNLQQIEFLSLMMVAAGSAGLQHPVLASGANLAVRKETYLKANQHLREKINTGDDMFLLEYLKKYNPESIVFLKDRRAIVRTPAVDSFKQFWNQRKRWTSKSTHYQDFEILGTELLVFLTNSILVISLLYGLSNPSWLLLPVSLMLFKTLSEWPLMESGCRFYQIRTKRKWFFLAQLIYPIYVVAIAIAGAFGGFTWKNRGR